MSKVTMHLGIVALLTFAFALISCGGNDQSEAGASGDTSQAAPDSLRTTAATNPYAVDTSPPDTDQDFELKRSIIYGTVPSQHDRIEHALKGVDKIIMFKDLGFGEKMELTAPPTVTPGWPVGNSVHKNLSDRKTALAVRFVLDTLPAPRVPGSAVFKLLGAQCGDQFGPGVEIPGVQGSMGTLEIYYRYNFPFVAVNCCEQGPQMGLNSFGIFGDTLLALFIFDPTRGDYTVQIIGPRGARGFPRNRYVSFRTSRGYLHPEASGFPYDCNRADSVSVDLAVGAMKRLKFDQMEPLLRVTLF
jgi:hypothetical protein